MSHPQCPAELPRYALAMCSSNGQMISPENGARLHGQGYLHGKGI